MKTLHVLLHTPGAHELTNHQPGEMDRQSGRHPVHYKDSETTPAPCVGHPARDHCHMLPVDGREPSKRLGWH